MGMVTVRPAVVWEPKETTRPPGAIVIPLPAADGRQVGEGLRDLLVRRGRPDWLVDDGQAGFGCGGIGVGQADPRQRGRGTVPDTVSCSAPGVVTRPNAWSPLKSVRLPPTPPVSP